MLRKISIVLSAVAALGLAVAVSAPADAKPVNKNVHVNKTVNVHRNVTVNRNVNVIAIVSVNRNVGAVAASSSVNGIMATSGTAITAIVWHGDGTPTASARAGSTSTANGSGTSVACPKTAGLRRSAISLSNAQAGHRRLGLSFSDRCRTPLLASAAHDATMQKNEGRISCARS